jgi:outer membrane protein assembly factor BamE (lipoprotein component of BamABCDE complex)
MVKILESNLSRRAAFGLGIAALVAGCSPEINNRGYRAKPGALAQVAEGMSKSEVEGILGSPSTTASVNYQGDSYYYISSTTQGRSFLEPKEINREVIAVRFDQQDQVTSVAQYGLEDGRIIDLNTRKTPYAGAEFNILRELFKGGGTVAPGENLKKRL